MARELYGSLHSQPICPMTWTEAETVKLAYNTYLGLKVLFANTVMEMCHRMPRRELRRGERDAEAREGPTDLPQVHGWRNGRRRALPRGAIRWR